MKWLHDFFWLAFGAALVASLGVLWHLYMASSLPGAQAWYTFYATPIGRKSNWELFDWGVPMFLLAPFAASFISGERGWFGACWRALAGAAAYDALVVGLLAVNVSFGLSPPPKLVRLGPGQFLGGLFCSSLFNGLTWWLAGMVGWYGRRENLRFDAAVRKARDSVRRITLLADDELEPSVKRLRVELTNGRVKILHRREITRFIEDIRSQLPKLAKLLHAETRVQRPWYRPARSSRRRQKIVVYEQASGPDTSELRADGAGPRGHSPGSGCE